MGTACGIPLRCLGQCHFKYLGGRYCFPACEAKSGAHGDGYEAASPSTKYSGDLDIEVFVVEHEALLAKVEPKRPAPPLPVGDLGSLVIPYPTAADLDDKLALGFDEYRKNLYERTIQTLSRRYQPLYWETRTLQEVSVRVVSHRTETCIRTDRHRT